MRVLDARAFIALDRGDRDSWALAAETQRAGRRLVVPAPVIAQAWSGAARQARLAAVLSGTEVVVVDGPLSRRAGELLATAGTAGFEEPPAASTGSAFCERQVAEAVSDQLTVAITCPSRSGTCSATARWTTPLTGEETSTETLSIYTSARSWPVRSTWSWASVAMCSTPSRPGR